MQASVSISEELLSRARALAEAVPDPEIPVLTLADLGVIQGADVVGDVIEITLIPTYVGCPATQVIQLDVQNALLMGGIENARVVTKLSPPWSTDLITDEGRAKLKAYGIAPPHKGANRGALLGHQMPECPHCGSARTERLSEFGSTPCKSLWRCTSCREPFDYFKCI